MAEPRPEWDSPAALLAEGQLDTAEKLRSSPFADEAKWALLVAAAGGHSIAFVGPPDVPTAELLALLPGLVLTARCVSIPSAASQDGCRDPDDLAAVEAADVILIEDFGAVSKPVLAALEDRLQLGEPRTKGGSTPPQLVMATRPCPCGFFGRRSRKCSCSVRAWKSYITRQHAAVLAAVDVHVDVDLRGTGAHGGLVNVERLALQVERARRHFYAPPRLIAHLTDMETLAEAPLGDSARWVLRIMARFGSLSAEETLRQMRIAFSLAVLEERRAIEQGDLVQAYYWRRNWWPGSPADGWVPRPGETLRRAFGEMG